MGNERNQFESILFRPSANPVEVARKGLILLDKVERALTFHRGGVNGLCKTCNTASPCPTRRSLTGE